MFLTSSVSELFGNSSRSFFRVATRRFDTMSTVHERPDTVRMDMSRIMHLADSTRRQWRTGHQITAHQVVSARSSLHESMVIEYDRAPRSLDMLYAEAIEHRSTQHEVDRVRSVGHDLIVQFAKFRQSEEAKNARLNTCFLHQYFTYTKSI